MQKSKLQLLFNKLVTAMIFTSLGTALWPQGGIPVKLCSIQAVKIFHSLGDWFHAESQNSYIQFKTLEIAQNSQGFDEALVPPK